MSVHYEPDGSIVVITLDRPDAANAIDRPTAEALAGAFRRFDADDALAVAVLTGANRRFCAGADLKAMREDAARVTRVQPDGDGPVGPTRMLLGKPVIAAIEGHAVAGGLELAAWCDLRVAAENAVFGVFCRRWGIPLMDGGTIRLARLLGHSHALDLILTGRGVSGDEALRMGLANRLVPPGRALPEAVALAREIASRPQAALPEKGSYVARDAAHTPILAVRGSDGQVRAFRNACRHRGTQLASGAGCEKAFVCRYHGWTYGLDGALRHVPHEYGFLGLDKSERGLVPVGCIEQSGLVFVTQDLTRAIDASVYAMPPLIGPDWVLLARSEEEVGINWKVLAESFLEGYHIRSTHVQTFYPVQFDNLNVVETFGRNSRIAYPYRAINKLRTVPPTERSLDGKLTYVYHLFPNVMLATFPANLFMVVIEPLAVDRTRFVNYVLGKPGEPVPAPQPRDDDDGRKRGLDLVTAGATEDRAMSCAVQRGLATGANEYFEFGRFEGAIGHFHRMLHAALAEAR